MSRIFLTPGKSLEIRKVTFKKNIICRDPAGIDRMVTDTSDI